MEKIITMTVEVSEVWFFVYPSVIVDRRENLPLSMSLENSIIIDNGRKSFLRHTITKILLYSR